MDSASRAGVLASGSTHGCSRVSRLTVTVLAAAFVAGVAKGAIAYASRSLVLKQHVAGTNAITAEVALAVIAATAVVTIEMVCWRRRGQSPWIAPFSGRAMVRLRQATRLPTGKAAARAVPVALMLLVIVYCPYRIGAQIIGGLDPNATVNAWGGPSYAGAMGAHYLDCLIGFYLAAFVLSRLLPQPTAQPVDNAH